MRETMLIPSYSQSIKYTPAKIASPLETLLHRVSRVFVITILAIGHA